MGYVTESDRLFMACVGLAHILDPGSQHPDTRGMSTKTAAKAYLELVDGLIRKAVSYMENVVVTDGTLSRLANGEPVELLGKRYAMVRTTTRKDAHKMKFGEKVPVCKHCGYGIGNRSWRFCPQCGAEITEVA